MKKNITLILSLFAAVGTLFACTPAPVQEQEQEDDPTENTGEDDPTGEDNPDQKPGEDDPDKPWEIPGEETLSPFVSPGPREQVSISRVDLMPDMPATYKMLDWRQKALDYDAYVFDWDATGEYRPLIWLDQTGRNSPYDGFGLYTTLGDIRQGPQSPGGHEAINTMAAVMGAGLVGIDKTSQDGYNYHQMLQNYFAGRNEWNIMVNGTSGFAQDWWYNILPNLLYWGVCDVFPGVEGADPILRSIADQFAKADEAMNGDYGYSWFKYSTMEGKVNNIPRQQDAAAGHAWVLLNAYRKFGDMNHLRRAVSAMTVINNLPESRFYEIVLPFGAYVGAVMNAMYGTSFEVGRVLRWSFEGNKSNGRAGWAVTVGQWGPYDISGLQGSITDGGGYAFQMNSYEMAWPLVPMVKYEPKFATTIGKWMLNNASASRLFFPLEIDDEYQACPDIKNITNNIIGYEGLRKRDRYGKISAQPVAEGDGPSWLSGMPDCTMFSLYSTSPIGIFGSIISTTDVEGILSLDCNVTDFYAHRPFPCHLLYNPYADDRTVTYKACGSAPYDLFDSVARDYAAKNASGDCSVVIPAKKAVLVYEIPAGTELYSTPSGHVFTKDRTIVAW